MPENRVIGAFYHDPPIWMERSAINFATSEQTVDFELFNHEVVRSKLRCGIEIRVSIEGVFAFDFSSWTPGRSPQIEDGVGGSFDKMAVAAINRSYIHNAYLALFYSRQVSSDKFTQKWMVVTPELEIPAANLEMESGQSFSSMRTAHLATIRLLGLRSLIDPLVMGSILMRGQPISASTARHAADDLSNVIEQGGVDDVLLLDLFLRGGKAYQDHNTSLSLVTYWTVIEKLINTLWKVLREDYVRDGKISIDSKRKDRLDGGRSFTASVVTEILSLAGYRPRNV